MFKDIINLEKKIINENVFKNRINLGDKSIFGICLQFCMLIFLSLIFMFE